MPEYLHPGVYVTEIAHSAKPIEGVSTSTADLIGSDTIARFQQLAQHVPDWTQHNDSDPGVTLLELFAFLTESILDRTERLPERGVVHAARLAAASLALVTDRQLPAGSVLKEVRFAPDQLLSDGDLTTEIKYVRGCGLLSAVCRLLGKGRRG